MKLTKTVLAQTEYPPYAVCASYLGGKRAYISAPGGKGEALLFVSGEGPRVMWDNSGTMSIVPDPDKGDCSTLYVTREFYPGTNAPGTYIDRAEYCEATGEWTMNKVVKRPFIHRHAIVKAFGKKFLLLCNLSEWKECKEDWSKPGGVFAVELFPDGSAGEVIPVYCGITKNHGFRLTRWDDCDAVIATGSEGAFVIKFDNENPLRWSVKKILSGEISELTEFDVDGDGEPEYGTIETFHGNTFNIYKKVNGEMKRVYRNENLERCHVIWGGVFGGERRFIVGNMAGTKQLISVQATSTNADDYADNIVVTELDAGGGPSNFCVFKENGHDCILSANWAAHEVVLYATEDEY